MKQFIAITMLAATLAGGTNTTPKTMGFGVNNIEKKIATYNKKANGEDFLTKAGNDLAKAFTAPLEEMTREVEKGFASLN